RLGRTHDVSDHRLGTKYLQTVTEDPTLTLGPADNSPATAWWFHSSRDSLERRPFDQIANFAVSEYQNIGNLCVWMHSDPRTEEEDRERTVEVFVDKLNRMPAELREKLGTLISEEWKALDAEVSRAAQQLWRRKKLPEPVIRDEVEMLNEWHKLCAGLAFRGADGIYLADINDVKEQAREQRMIFDDDEDVDSAAVAPQAEWDKAEWDKRVIAALRAYLDEAAKEGIAPSPFTSASRTRMFGCGAKRGKGATYRWAYDGTYIYGSDSETVPSERTYWTDHNGQLVGKHKGVPGQTWTIAPWKPTPAQAESDVSAILLTGLFGPIGSVLGL
ncbi:hypothetical protein, partial [Streptomyces anulatus]|uniref:hypothetical protein n=2 Tax=Actinomycetes TaxID=1760 RepID=UPI0036B71B66